MTDAMDVFTDWRGYTLVAWIAAHAFVIGWYLGRQAKP